MEFKYDIVKDFGTLSQKGAYHKKMTLISWNGATPKIDIRVWNTDADRMSKGVSISKDEAIQLRDLLNKIDFDDVVFTEAL